MSDEFSYILHQIESGHTDGLTECETIVKSYGGTIEKFEIVVKKSVWKEVELLRDCIDFLVNEWQYKFKTR